MVSKAREDFPEPLTPVTTMSSPRGRRRFSPLRLFWRAPFTRMKSEDMQPRFASQLFRADLSIDHLVGQPGDDFRES